jgi:hypothetical protein
MASSPVANPQQQILDADAFVNFILVQPAAAAADFIVLTLRGRSVQQARKISQRYAQFASIDKIHLHGAHVETHRFRKEFMPYPHATSLQQHRVFAEKRRCVRPQLARQTSYR